MTDTIEIAKNAFRAYVNDDREALEALIAEDFHFTSPYDNAIGRKTYFERCWVNHAAITQMNFIRALQSDNEVVITYEGGTRDGKIFRNTEVLTVEAGKITAAEVYFGWNVPHAAPPGSFKNPAKETSQ